MKGFLFITFLFSFFVVFSQPAIHFETRIHDFGTIQEVNGPVAYDFEFINQGNTPILIKNVESSCGCTSPEWTKQPVLPGKKGFVKATFSPKDRPGYFDKTITVYSNARPGVMELKIKGTVQGKARTILDDYPYELPSGLRLPLEEISLMKVHKGEVKSMAVGVFNNAGKQVSVRFTDVPAYMQFAIEPQQIANKMKAVIKAAYNTALHGEFGLNREKITMLVDGKKYELPVSIYVEENFKEVNVAVAPIAEVDKKYYNFGTIPASQVATFTYQLKNTGKSPLKIHRIYTNDHRVVAEMSEKEIQPGGMVPIVVRTVHGADMGAVSAVVSVITNSPTVPELKIRFYGEIK